MANPSGSHHQEEANHASSTFNGVHNNSIINNNNNSSNGHENSNSNLKHNPGISTDWTPEEQQILDDGLAKFGGLQSVARYAKIAVQLPNKTVRDVALRCRWMSRKEGGKRRKEENLARKPKEKKERAVDFTTRTPPLMAMPNSHSFASQTMRMDYDKDMSSKVIGGFVGELLKENTETFNRISANQSKMELQENVMLFCQTHKNILMIMKDMKDMPDLMKQMPALPVKLNEQLLESILPPFFMQEMINDPDPGYQVTSQGIGQP